MLVEKFSKDGKAGVKFKDAQFACSRNYNGCNFDALEVFNIDNPPKAFNKSHNATVTLQAEFSSPVKPEINGKLLTFKADIVSYDAYIVENADKITGFSPELQPLNKPVKNAGGERFYAQGDLGWQGTAVLFGEKAGFVGVDNNFKLEKFSLNEDVIILEDAEAEKETFNLVSDLRNSQSYYKAEIANLSKRLDENVLAIQALVNAGLEFFKKDPVSEAEAQDLTKSKELDQTLAIAEAKAKKPASEDFTAQELEKFKVIDPKSSSTVGDIITDAQKQSLIKKLNF